MSPKEKAKELVLKYAMYIRSGYMFDEDADEDANQCALIAVDELIKLSSCFEVTDNYYEKVKKEIEKL